MWDRFEVGRDGRRLQGKLARVGPLCATMFWNTKDFENWKLEFRFPDHYEDLFYQVRRIEHTLRVY